MQLNDQECISNEEELIKFYQSGRYNPQENTDNVMLMATLMIILNAKGAQRAPIASLPFFNHVVKDIKNYVARVHHFDRNFITVCFLFCKELMPYID